MATSRVDVLLHIVWATYRRLPLVAPEIERAVYACLLSEARQAGCEVLAIGGMPDHVHVALRLSPEAAIAHVVRRMKGVSSTLVRKRLKPGETFGWQDGYAAFSVSRSHEARVLGYVRNQKRHHADNALWPDWETSDAPAYPAHAHLR